MIQILSDMTYTGTNNQMLELHDIDGDIFFANLSDISNIVVYYNSEDTCNAKVIFKNNTSVRCKETVSMIRKKLSKLTNIT